MHWYEMNEIQKVLAFLSIIPPVVLTFYFVWIIFYKGRP